MTLQSEVQTYVERQASFGWRRKLMQVIAYILGFKILWRVKMVGMENIPTSGGTIIMMNHTSSLDPVLCMTGITKRWVVPMTKAENMESPLLNFFVQMWGAYPVKRGEVDRKALLNSIELLKSGQVILIAPEGHRNLDGLHEAKDGLAYIATKSDAVIVPTGITGAIGWKEKMRRFERPEITVTFGKPFRLKTAGKERVPREALTAMSHEAMYQLALALPDEALRGYYRDLSQLTTDHLTFV